MCEESGSEESGSEESGSEESEETKLRQTEIDRQTDRQTDECAKVYKNSVAESLTEITAFGAIFLPR